MNRHPTATIRHYRVGGGRTACGLPAIDDRPIAATSIAERATCQRCRAWLRREGRL